MQPLFDGEIGIRVTLLTGCEFLKGGREDADRHVCRIERCGLGHAVKLLLF